MASRRITKDELRQIVESKVNEAWYNNAKDFGHALGKAAAIGGLGAATLAGGAYCLDKGLDNYDKQQQAINRQGIEMSYGTPAHYEQWCQERNLDPDDKGNIDYYNEWVDSKMEESKTRKIVESLVRKHLTECVK